MIWLWDIQSIERSIVLALGYQHLSMVMPIYYPKQSCLGTFCSHNYKSLDVCGEVSFQSAICRNWYLHHQPCTSDEVLYGVSKYEQAPNLVREYIRCLLHQPIVVLKPDVRSVFRSSQEGSIQVYQRWECQSPNLSLLVWRQALWNSLQSETLSTMTQLLFKCFFNHSCNFSFSSLVT